GHFAQRSTISRGKKRRPCSARSRHRREHSQWRGPMMFRKLSSFVTVLRVAVVLLLPVTAWPQQAVAPPDLVGAVKVAVPQERIDGILERVRSAKLPRQMPATSAEKPAWETGADIQWLEGLRQYWTTKFSWRAAEARLNRYPQYKARVDGVDIHFY